MRLIFNVFYIRVLSLPLNNFQEEVSLVDNHESWQNQVSEIDVEMIVAICELITTYRSRITALLLLGPHAPTTLGPHAHSLSKNANTFSVTSSTTDLGIASEIVSSSVLFWFACYIFVFYFL